MFGSPKRFVEVVRDGSLLGNIRVIQDMETGVQYLCGFKNAEITAITPLLDRDGNVMVGRE